MVSTNKSDRPLEYFTTKQIFEELGQRFRVLALIGIEGVGDGCAEHIAATQVGSIPESLGMMRVFESRLLRVYENDCANVRIVSQDKGGDK